MDLRNVLSVSLHLALLASLKMALFDSCVFCVAALAFSASAFFSSFSLALEPLALHVADSRIAVSGKLSGAHVAPAPPASGATHQCGRLPSQ